ncbi:aldose 1-epimerase [Microvirga sp. BT689]|uniref:aldose 1-epimerase n=1 Tax=Microvirga arvi TaxID=2778731 RepID=UPI0019505130|nr:aldose 1-epimerase [Microvirga arvi]MBM6580714.1 aldose 1-epimerase [Microvirga arvi]
MKLDLAPSIGGTIAGFWHDDAALMRETPEQALRDGLVRQTSCYPLIPYSNRIAQGRFSFEGVEHRLALNFGDHPHSIHGNAWHKPWQVAEVEEPRCRLVLIHRPEGDGAWGWPFAYRAEQIFELSPDGLKLTLMLVNTDHRPMPAGLGLHPFFPKRPGVRLQFAAERVYPNCESSLPMDSMPVPPVWNYRAMRELGEPHLDNCFASWNGIAHIAYPQEKTALNIEADPLFGHLVVYVPTGRDFFAVEPVSHMNNAINRPDPVSHGLMVLGPGERLTARVRFGVEILS